MLRLGLGFLLRLELFGSQALAGGLGGGFLFQVDVLGKLVESDLDSGHVEQLLSIRTEQRDLVFAGRDAQGEVLALLIQLERIFAARVGVEPFHGAVGDDFSFLVPDYALHRARGLGKDWRNAQSERQRKQHRPCKRSFHLSLPANCFL